MKQFSIHVISAFKTAEAEARRLGSDCVDTQHVLLGMLAEADGTAGKILQRLGCDVGTIRNQLRGTPAKAASAKRGQSLPQSAAVKQAIEAAIEGAGRDNSPSTGTEHLLLAFMRQPNCRACVVLAQAGATIDVIRAAVEEENAGAGDAGQP